jgi:hypothetical protein
MQASVLPMAHRVYSFGRQISRPQRVVIASDITVVSTVVKVVKTVRPKRRTVSVRTNNLRDGALTASSRKTYE